MSNYTDLRDSIIDWADNEDVTQRVDSFITMANLRLNRRLRLEDMTKFAEIQTVSGEMWVPKPSGYRGMRRMKVMGDSKTASLRWRSFNEIDDSAKYNQQGRPEVYAVAGDRIRLGPIPGGEYMLEVVYYKTVDALSSTNDTDPVFYGQVGDLYLYAALMEAEPYLKDNEMWDTWVKMYQEKMEEVRGDTEAQKFPDGELAVRAV